LYLDVDSIETIQKKRKRKRKSCSSFC